MSYVQTVSGANSAKYGGKSAYDNGLTSSTKRTSPEFNYSLAYCEAPLTLLDDLYFWKWFTLECDKCMF